MRVCRACQGFIPPALARCPHCDATMRLRDKVATGLLVSSAAMTLMACYGLPPGCEDLQCFDDDTTGGVEQGMCDPETTPEILQAQASANGQLLAQSGTNEGTCGGAGYEVVYEWTPQAAGTYQIVVQPPANALLNVYVRDPSSSGSCGDEIQCEANEMGENVEVTVQATSTDPVLIVVDGRDTTVSGAYTLTITEQ
jgi:hypothetical protein